MPLVRAQLVLVKEGTAWVVPVEALYIYINIWGKICLSRACSWRARLGLRSSRQRAPAEADGETARSACAWAWGVLECGRVAVREGRRAPSWISCNITYPNFDNV